VGATSQYVHVASSLPAFLAGSVAGITGCVVGHPFDLLKVVQQTSDKNKTISSAIRTATAKGYKTAQRRCLTGLFLHFSSS
jgi:hypothetical protein